MPIKVYAVYSIPKSPEYKLDALFMTKELAKEYIKKQKKCLLKPDVPIFDIQIEEVQE